MKLWWIILTVIVVAVAFYQGTEFSPGRRSSCCLSLPPPRPRFMPGILSPDVRIIIPRQIREIPPTDEVLLNGNVYRIDAINWITPELRATFKEIDFCIILFRLRGQWAHCPLPMKPAPHAVEQDGLAQEAMSHWYYQGNWEGIIAIKIDWYHSSVSIDATCLTEGTSRIRTVWDLVRGAHPGLGLAGAWNCEERYIREYISRYNYLVEQGVCQ